MGPKSLFGVPQAKGVWLFCTPMLSQSRIKQERILSVVSPWQLLWTRCGRFTSLPTGWNAQRRQHHMGDGWKAPYCLGLSVLSQLPVAACQPWNYVCMVNVYPQLPNSDRPQWHGKPLRSLRKPAGLLVGQSPHTFHKDREVRKGPIWGPTWPHNFTRFLRWTGTFCWGLSLLESVPTCYCLLGFGAEGMCSVAAWVKQS